jgi:Stigma-specific protein, Stig1
MKKAQLVAGLGLLLTGVVACSSRMSIGEGTGRGTGALDQNRNGDGSCGEALTECNGSCRDLSSDAANCGACGATCAEGKQCTSGECVAKSTPRESDADAPDSGEECPAGQVLCGEACVDLLSDSANCGVCGQVCESDKTCSQGACVEECPAGQVHCGGACVDLLSDSVNCGACANVCESGKTCTQAVCR